MPQQRNIDGVLIQWGDRLFYPGNRIVKTKPAASLAAGVAIQRAAAIRERIAATVMRRAPQVMVKVTGGGRGMKAIAAHFRYISKNGRLDIEDERGEVMTGKGALRELADDWRLGGTLIEDVGDRREAFNVMLSMPRGTDPSIVQKAAREFAQTELADHKYVMVLHDHQASPHVHLSVRAESTQGKRLSPRKADLSRWRQTFAEKLRGWGIEAEASSRIVRGQGRASEPLWRLKAREDQRLTQSFASSSKPVRLKSEAADEAWSRLAAALSASDQAKDRELGAAVGKFVTDNLVKPEPSRTAFRGRGLDR
jgi:hypothetical protein